jgi:hypothetical protein
LRLLSTATMEPGVSLHVGLSALHQTSCSLNEGFELVRVRNSHLLETFVHILHQFDGTLSTLTSNGIPVWYCHLHVKCFG